MNPELEETVKKMINPNIEESKKKMNIRYWLKLLSMYVLKLCTVFIVVVIAGMYSSIFIWKTPSLSTKVVDVPFENIVEKVIPSVVHIQYEGEEDSWQGSGVIISENGVILTARHVVENPGTFTITLNDGRTITTKKACVSKDYDVGFLKLPVGNLPSTNFGDSEKMRLGTRLLAIGSQFGKDHFNSVTLGILSAMRSNLDESGYGWSVLLQTDVSANSGSSGGPIFNMEGEVVGIVVGAPVLPYAGIIYCVPSNVCKGLVNSTSLVFALQELTSVSGDTISERLNDLDYRIGVIENTLTENAVEMEDIYLDEVSFEQ